jgi:hypothetical protein
MSRCKHCKHDAGMYQISYMQRETGRPRSMEEQRAGRDGHIGQLNYFYF